MKGEKCDLCGKDIAKYGTEYVSIRLLRNYQSQGCPDVFAVKTVEACLSCAAQAVESIEKNHEQPEPQVLRSPQ